MYIPPSAAPQADNARSSSNQALMKLLEYTIPGAEFNSAARDPPPRCYPDTRNRIFTDLHNHIANGKKIVWMHGPFGVGKSAIMETLAGMVSLQSTCATLFFSRHSNPPRNDSKKVFTTLAYSLATANVDYRKYIEEKLFQDPAFLDKSLEEQFNRLFLAPFANDRVPTGHQRWVMLLDGLDQCKNEEDDQRRILNLICDSFFFHPGPFVWVIASRPEPHLMHAVFWGLPTSFWAELSITFTGRGVGQYIRQEFSNIRRRHPDSFPDSTSIWPSKQDILKIIKASSGFFAFASILMKYLSMGRPVSRLKFVIAIVDKSTLYPDRIPQEPLPSLDMQYTQIMMDIPEEQLSITKSLLGYYCLIREWTISGEGLVEACNILGLCQDDAYDALYRLRSVLGYPSPWMAQFDGVKFFHVSFLDFLLDHTRSQNYYIDLDQELTSIWRCYTRILKEFSSVLPTPIYDGINVQWTPVPDDDTYLEGLQESLLRRAQRGWVSLLMGYGHLPCTSCPRPANDRRLMADALELADTFRSIHPLSFDSGEFPVKEFVDWFNNHAPEGVREAVILQEFLDEIEAQPPRSWSVLSVDHEPVRDPQGGYQTPQAGPSITPLTDDNSSVSDAAHMVAPLTSPNTRDPGLANNARYLEPPETRGRGSDADQLYLSDINVLLESSVLDAVYDSPAREPPPRCLPGSRRQVDDIVYWALAYHDRLNPVLWVNGPAGVGKSAVAQTCAEEFAASGQLAASFFFSKLNGRNKPNELFPTIAYQLLHSDPSYCDIIESRLVRDPTITQRSLIHQFQELIVSPVEEASTQGRDVPKGVIIIDGLDECAHADTQCEIIKAVCRSVRRQGTPLLWVFFSRQEPHLERTFSSEEIVPLCEQITLSNPYDEVKAYLRGGLREIQRYHSSLLSPQWPSDDDIQKLAEMSSSFFLYAEHILREVDDEAIGDPDKQLHIILVDHPRLHVVPTLDSSYLEIMHSIPSHILPLARQVLLSVRISGGESNVTVLELSDLLSIRQDDFYAICNELRSVLGLRGPMGESPHTYMHFYHASFMDFLQDPARSRSVSTSNPEVVIPLLRCYIHFVNNIHTSGTF
ncbi:hypothetical protein P691DRAFT_736830 [Macrolepiota fuliginosa MF-IS2]|uniref:Nephrocystin 3-like N-terminal domain-containing protein n=1 Tax=Macrolepiota fuliginosa MF-IS2 TaxID=1400762 RepID=A0A9P5X4A7_9AGAR|nr:hypothetical protein P691DRAFT_736830 [Macrolepiota fuliginosa MF-IS2]